MLFSVRAMCWACTGCAAHGAQVFVCYYASHFEQKNVIINAYAAEKTVIKGRWQRKTSQAFN
jgi:hypothetical protein